MQKVLERCHAGEIVPAAIDELIRLPGTQLIIAQQNISRRITTDQYRDVLISACKGESADIKPADAGARALKGAEGLMRDVGPSLLWGRDHVATLKHHVASAIANVNTSHIVPLAVQNLPEKVELSPKLYFVMGGRAGAAAFENAIYIDLLADAWRRRDTSSVMSPEEMTEFFAHETHHIGYGEVLEKRKKELHLSAGEEQAWSFLTAIMMEGSATLLINAHGSWADLAKQDHIKADIARLPQLLPATQGIFQETLSGEMKAEKYQTAISEFLGEGYHSTGAWLLHVIEQAQGKSGVLKVMDDPRKLLSVYNKCATKTNEPFRFEPAVAKAVEQMGQEKH
jgi:hypothetical protein